MACEKLKKKIDFQIFILNSFTRHYFKTLNLKNINMSTLCYLCALYNFKKKTGVATIILIDKKNLYLKLNLTITH